MLRENKLNDSSITSSFKQKKYANCIYFQHTNALTKVEYQNHIKKMGSQTKRYPMPNNSQNLIFKGERKHNHVRTCENQSKKTIVQPY